MAKKKKTKQKPPPKKKSDGLPALRQPRRRLLAKIARIRDEIPDIEPSGEEKDEQGKHLFFYTEAQDVFKRYIEALKRHNLLVRPYAEPGMMPQIVTQGRLVIASIAFEVVDLDTGESIVGAGIGGGINYDWAPNTCQTRALKQFFLTTFGACWRDPEVIAKQEADRMLSEARNPLLSADAVKELKEFDWGTPPTKPKKKE